MNRQNFTKTKVFISYSWDSEEHKTRVKNFVLKLRSDDINVLYDGDIKSGDRFTKFMEDSIRECDVILLICTPLYKQKADSRISGVGYENNIFTAELYETQCENKFIPVLFEGTWKESVPIWAKGKIGVNLINSLEYSFEYERLLKQLLSTINNEHEPLCKDKIENKELNLEEQINERFTEIFGVDEGITNVNKEASKKEPHSIINDIVKYHILENMQNKCEKNKKSFCPRDVDNILLDFILFQEKGIVNEKNIWRNFSLIDNCKASTIIYEVIEKPDITTKRYRIYAERIIRSSKLLADGRVSRTFYIERKEGGNSLIFLTFSDSFVVINTGSLLNKEVKASKEPLMIEYNQAFLDKDNPFIIRCEKETKEYKIRTFKGDVDSNYIIIDFKTQEDVKRKMFDDFDQNKWTCSIDLKANHSYFVFQIRSKVGYEMNNMQIATSYERGDGDFPVNILQALKYYDLAKCSEGDYHIGLIFLRDNECHNVEEGLYYLCKAANANYIPAMVSLASQYLFGKLCEQDLQKTFYWWRKAINAINCVIKKEIDLQYKLADYFDIMNVIADNLYDKEMIDEPVYLKYEKYT